MPVEPLYREDALLNQIAQGDEKAFRIIFDHYRDAIYSFALKVTHRETTAEEIVQDVFVKIWIHRNSITEVRHFGNFLFIIARNHAFNCLRQLAKERKIVSQPSEQLADEALSAETIVIQRDFDKLLEQGIAQLPPQQKLVYTLSRQYRLTREEIAAQLHIAPGTVKAHMAQALQSLRSYIKTHDSGLLLLLICMISDN